VGLIEVDTFAEGKLLTDISRERETVLRKDVLHEPTAVKPGRVASAASIRDAAKSQGRFDHSR
jgi:hypothetical protein